MSNGLIRTKVAPYALYDVLKALENDNDDKHYIDYSVTKQDNDLIVYAEKVELPKTTSKNTAKG